MEPEIADAPSPDGVLVAACAVARAAVAAYDVQAELDDPGDALATLFDRERLAIECVAVTKARTPRGLVEKVILFALCEETPETVSLALSIAEDAVALVKTMVGGS